MAATVSRRNTIRQGRDESPVDKKCPFWKSMFCEFIGTFFLTFVSAGAMVVASITGELNHIDKILPAGMLVAAMIWSLGAISGAHFNPAVTLAFALRKAFPWRDVPGYWLAQLVASIAAAAALLTLFGQEAHLGATTPRSGDVQSLVMEIIWTYLLIAVILGTAQQHKIVGANAAMAVGMTIILCGLVGGPISGASMNPARSFGPALLGGTMTSYWIYVVGPVIGAGLAVFVTTLLHGSVDGDEEVTALGEEGDNRHKEHDRRQV